jgi:hypothetical protein
MGVKACAIVVLDGGVVHPGAHVCGKELRQPICEGRHTMSAMAQAVQVSIQEASRVKREMARRESQAGAMKIATRSMSPGWSQ